MYVVIRFQILKIGLDFIASFSAERFMHLDFLDLPLVNKSTSGSKFSSRWHGRQSTIWASEGHHVSNVNTS